MNKNDLFVKLIMGVKVYFIAIILFIAASFAQGNYPLAIAESFVLVLLAIYYFTSRNFKQKQITSYMENMYFHLDNATRDSMTRLPLPVTVLDLSGIIVWYNKRFGDIAGENVFDKSITKVVSGIQILKILENRDNISLEVDFKGRHFQVLGSVVDVTDNRSTSYSIVLYWIDRTEEKQSMKLREDSMPVSCILMVDNFDDLISSNSNNDSSSLIATIDKNIHTWVSNLGGVSMKYEKDKHYIIFENASLQNVIEQKFTILNVSREIQAGNTIPVTLSIGIGHGDTIHQSDMFARAAIDMALGRGGDQAVIKDAKGFTFFGGRSEGLEKNTRVKARTMAYALRELIKQTNEVFITGHQNADFDSFGASVGVAKMVSLLGKKPYIIIDGIQNTTAKAMESLRHDEQYDEIFISESEAQQLYTKTSLLIIVDTHKPSYIQAQRLLKSIPNKVLIDHHRRSAEYIEDAVLTYHEPFASSTCEMVTEILEYITDAPKLSPKEAQAVYAGIALDTKNFSIKTGVRTFDAAAFLRRMGVDTIEVKRLFQNDLSAYKKRAAIVGNAEIYKGKIAISPWDQNEKEPNIVTSQAADELLNISNISASFVLCKCNDRIVISGRSLGNYNVQVVLEQLGGGGHMTVAGAQLRNISMHEAVNQLKEAIDKVN